jgi:putative tryptophan/tyrosine transport system substrate-binding protein
MRRRELMALLGSTIVWPLATRAQQKAMPVVGTLNLGSPPANLGDPAVRNRGPIHQGMGEMGFVEGQNMMWENRWAEGHYDRLPALAADLVSRNVDVIITIDGTPSAIAAKNATSTIPIVFLDVGDPVGFGLVASLARPGGNLTGFSNLTVELEPKQIELLCELVPKATVITLLVNPANPIADKHIRTTQEGARAKGIKLAVLKATTEGQINAAFEQLQTGTLLVASDAFFGSRHEQLVALAARYGVAAMYWNPVFVAAGGLISYGTDMDALWRQAGIYAGKILQGAKPANLPVQQPTLFKLVINLKTAKALGLTIPQSILARADEVIE